MITIEGSRANNCIPISRWVVGDGPCENVRGHNTPCGDVR